MKMSIFLSVTGRINADHLAMQTARVCVSHKFTANVVPLYSSLPDVNGYQMEAGCRIDLLSVPKNRFDDVLYLWRRLLDLFGPELGCMHMIITGSGMQTYDGCIRDWDHYRINWNLIHDAFQNCGYDHHASDRVRHRNGKPLS